MRQYCLHLEAGKRGGLWSKTAAQALVNSTSLSCWRRAGMKRFTQIADARSLNKVFQGLQCIRGLAT